MRITVTLNDRLAGDLKRFARNEGRSVSKFVAEAVETHLLERRKKRMGKKVLDMAGKVRISQDAMDILEKGRRDDRA